MAEYIGSTSNTIKTIEAGRAAIGKSLADKIKAELGAVWVEWKKLWEFAGKEGVPYTHEIFIQYRSCLDTPPHDPRVVAAHTGDKVRVLMELSGERFSALRFRIERDIAN